MIGHGHLCPDTQQFGPLQLTLVYIHNINRNNNHLNVFKTYWGDVHHSFKFPHLVVLTMVMDIAVQYIAPKSTKGIQLRSDLEIAEISDLCKQRFLKRCAAV